MLCNLFYNLCSNFLKTSSKNIENLKHREWKILTHSQSLVICMLLHAFVQNTIIYMNSAKDNDFVVAVASN